MIQKFDEKQQKVEGLVPFKYIKKYLEESSTNKLSGKISSFCRISMDIEGSQRGRLLQDRGIDQKQMLCFLMLKKHIVSSVLNNYEVHIQTKYLITRISSLKIGTLNSIHGIELQACSEVTHGFLSSSNGQNEKVSVQTLRNQHRIAQMRNSLASNYTKYYWLIYEKDQKK
ncbi:UNKNOWN [Stylonychia lemnae]|uniref:Uncharacterized protein n=1 Tax=Stylonychia lemnae TaxID=5949 RepID=A0A078ATF3_STYLE|nr:UNKNOWN [Stylonychia lemnae]|eukprot:CDW84148.1 UNKNOWN [Stylonychia lemnae]